MKNLLKIVTYLSAFIISAYANAALPDNGKENPVTLKEYSSGNFINQVTCRSDKDCFAVGEKIKADSRSESLIIHWDGSAWSIVPSPSPGDYGNQLSGVSCSRENNTCVAVGFSQTAGGTGPRNLILKWDGKVWDVVPSPSPEGINGLRAISCETGAACVAVGRNLTPNDGGKTLVMSLRGTTWEMNQSLNPGTSDNSLFDIACSDPLHCTAVGFYEGAFSETDALILNGSADTWKLNASPTPSGDAVQYISGISCQDADHCMAVGAYGVRQRQGWILQLIGGDWVTSSPALPNTVLRKVDCRDAANCTAIGSIDLDKNAFSIKWDGVRWSPLVSPNPGTGANYFTGISCPKNGVRCIAVGTFREEGSFKYSPMLYQKLDSESSWTKMPSPFES